MPFVFNDEAGGGPSAPTRRNDAKSSYFQLERFGRSRQLVSREAQVILDALEQPLLVLDEKGCVVDGNRAFFEKFVLERDEAIGYSLFALGTFQWDIVELRNLLRNVILNAAAITELEVTADFAPIGRRTMVVSARRLPRAQNNTRRILMAFEDVTDRRRGDAEKDIILGEIRHRAKNLFAVVRAIANQTEVEGRSGEEYRDAFLGRFEAVLRAENISRDDNAETDLGVLIGHAFEPIGPNRSRIDPGPPVSLMRDQIVPMSLILHELATNAFKYGALSTAQGVVHLTWRIATEAGGSTLHLDWMEENGPPVTPPHRSGFGTRLIEFTAVHSLEGSAELRFEPGGLQVHVTARLH